MKLGRQSFWITHLHYAFPVHGHFPARWTKLFYRKAISLRAIQLKKTPTPQLLPRRPASIGVRRPRTDQKVPELPAVPRKPARLGPRLLPKLKKNVSSKSSKIYIFLPMALTQRFWTIPVTPTRVETWKIPGQIHRVHPWPLIKSLAAYLVF